MKPLPILDVYTLSMLDRGLSSLYELQRQAGLSLGASTPALERLKKLGLVTRTVDRSRGKRKKYQFELTAEGRQTVKNAWRKCLNGQPPADIDSVLRIIDLGLHYGANISEISEFAVKAAEARLIRSQQAVRLTDTSSPTVISKYPQLRSLCEQAILKAEAQALETISVLLGRAREPHKTAGKPRSRIRRFAISRDQQSFSELKP